MCSSTQSTRRDGAPSGEEELRHSLYLGHGLALRSGAFSVSTALSVVGLAKLWVAAYCDFE
jgi:hypothetical protein